MTAQQVDGVEVVSDEPTTSAIRTRSGEPVIWEQTRTLTLADGRVTYGCQHCDYVNDNMMSIRPHLGAHNKAGPRAGSRANSRARTVTELAQGMSLSDLLGRLAQLEQVGAERDAWKARAQSAERNLATLRRALTGSER